MKNEGFYYAYRTYSSGRSKQPPRPVSAATKDSADEKCLFDLKVGEEF